MILGVAWNIDIVQDSPLSTSSWSSSGLVFEPIITCSRSCTQ